ncbi:insulinase family protein, partial [bacterium]
YSSFDRSKEPAKGKSPDLKLPTIWTDSLDNGLKIYAIEQNELPMVNFSMTIQGGMLLENQGKIGVSNLLAQLMKEGTKNKTPEELEEELDLLGSTVSISSGKESINISGNTLSRNYGKTIALVKEMLLEPRWDANEFAKIKEKTINAIRESGSNPDAIARKAFTKIIFKDTILANQPAGTINSVQAITLDDLKDYYNKNLSPSLANFHVAGDVSKTEIKNSIDSLNKDWLKKDVKLPEINLSANTQTPKLYFVDLPKAKQSVIQVGGIALSQKDSDFYPATFTNYKLGGNFSSNLNIILREEKGYTYGARSAFSGSRFKGPFIATSSVRTNSTADSVKIFKEEIENYHNKVNADDLEFTKNSLIKANALRFESLGALISMLQNISTYDLPLDYIKREENISKSLTLADVKQVTEKYIKPQEMNYLVVGDAETQLAQLKNLGLGEPILLDVEGNPIKK